MRLIKFKVWDNVDTMWGPYTLKDLMNPGRVEFTDDCPILQYTGLKDRNGKEIYEGDIVKGVYFSGPTVVEFKVRRSREVGHGDWTGYVNAGYQLDGFMTDDPENHVQVIGNIYENPELLKP